MISRARIIGTYQALSGLYTLAASLIWGVNTLFLFDAGLGITEVFIANATFSAGMVLFEIPTGVVADTLGRRVSYLASVAILGVTTVAYLGAHQLQAGLVTFMVVSAFMGLGFTFYSGALEAWLVDGLKAVGSDNRLDHVFARASQVNGAAMFVGTIVGGFAGQLNLTVPFIARTLLLVAVFVVAGRLMTEIGFEPKELRWRDVPKQMRQQAAVGVSAGWNHRGLRLLMLADGFRAIFFGWAFYAAQPYFLELLQRDVVWVVGLVTAGVSLATIAGNQIVDFLSKRCGHRTTVLLWSSAVSVAASISIGLTSEFWVAVAGLLTVAVTVGVIRPIRQGYLHQVTSSEHRATIISFDAMVASIGGVGGQVGLGTVAERSSFSAGYIIGGALSGLALPALFLLRSRRDGADQIGVSTAGSDSNCPQGLPQDIGIKATTIEEVEA